MIYQIDRTLTAASYLKWNECHLSFLFWNANVWIVKLMVSITHPIIGGNNRGLE